MSQPTFAQQITQTFQEIPINRTSVPKSQELRKAHQFHLQSLKLANIHPKLKLQGSFWNHDISRIEIDMSKLMHEIAYFDKPDVIRQQPHFQQHYRSFLSQKGSLNLTLERQREALLRFFENDVASLFLRRRWLLRNRIKQLHIPSVLSEGTPGSYHDRVDYNKFDLRPPEDEPRQPDFENIYYRPRLSDHRASRLEKVDLEIQLLEKQIAEYDSLCDRLAHEKLFESQVHYDKVHVPQLQINATDELIFDKVNQKVLESMPYLKMEHLRYYYDKVHNKQAMFRKVAIAKIYLESALYRAQFECTVKPEKEVETHDFQIPLTLRGLQEQLQQKATSLGVNQDITIDNGALFLYALDKRFAQDVEEQSLEYLQFLPYEIEVDQGVAIQSTASLNGKAERPQPRQSFQQYTIKMLKEMKEESLRKKQFRVRSAVHWVDTIQILPDQTPNDLQSRLIFEQYDDTAVKSWINFLLYHETDKINLKISKDIQLMAEKAKQYDLLPDIYFQFYHRMLKLYFVDSRRSLIQILNVLNVFRTTQKNLNIYYMELNMQQHTLGKERLVGKKGAQLSSQQDSFNLGFMDESFFITNPAQAQNGRSSQHSSAQHASIAEHLANNEPTKLQSTSYFCEETVTFEDGLFKVLDGEGFKVLNESALQDFFDKLTSLQHKCSFILLYSLKHGFEEESVLKQNKSEQQRYLDTLNREKIVQEVLEFEANWLTSKCRIIQVIQPLLSNCGSDLLYNSICHLTWLMSLQPVFELKNTVLERYRQQCELMHLVAIICEHLRDQNPQVNVGPLVKLLLNVVGAAFPSDEQFTIEERRMALLDFYHNHLRQHKEAHHLPVPQEYQHLYNDLILDSKDNFDVLMMHLLGQHDKGQVESFNCNVFSILEFQRLRRRCSKSLLRILWNVEIVQRQVGGMGRSYQRKFQDQVEAIQQASNPRSSRPQNASIRSEEQEISHDSSKKNPETVEMLHLLLEEGVSYGKELSRLAQWGPLVSDTLKLLDLTTLLNGLLLLSSFTLNAVQINTSLFKSVSQQMPPDLSEEKQYQIYGYNLQQHFINVVLEKAKWSLVAQNNQRTKQAFHDEEQQETHQNVSHSQTVLQQVTSLLRTGRGRGGTVLQSTLQNFIKKLHGGHSLLQEMNNLLNQQCVTTAYTLIALHQRTYLIELNSRLPFAKPIFSFVEHPIELDDIEVIRNPNHDTLSDEDQAEGFLDSRGYIANLFTIPSIGYIFHAKHHLEGHHRQANTETSSAYADTFQYMPGGEEWSKTQSLKVEQNVPLLTPTKKLTKFRSAGYPYTNKSAMDISGSLQLLSSSMQVCIQLMAQLLAHHSSSCNRIDLIFLQAGYLGQEQNRVDKLTPGSEYGYYKRNQLRLRRDLEQMVRMIENVKAQVKTIGSNQSILHTNEAILTWLCKFTNRVYLTQLTTILTAINQFRQHPEEEFAELVCHLKRLLVQVQFRNIGQIERMPGQTPQVIKTVSSSMIESYSPMMALMKHMFSTGCPEVKWSGAFYQHRIAQVVSPLDYYTQLSPYMLPTQSSQLFSQRLNFNPASYFFNVNLQVPTALQSLFTQFPQSKLIYLSTIQDVILSESDEALRNRFVFEKDDPFTFEREYTKLLKIQFRYLLFAECILINKFQVLPFEVIPQTSDPIAELLVQMHRNVTEQHRKQNLKSSILLAIPKVTHEITSAIKFDLEQTAALFKPKHKPNEKQEQSYASQQLSQKTQPTLLQQYAILDKLRIESFASSVFKLTSTMIECHNLMLNEGVEYYNNQCQQIAKSANQLKIQQPSSQPQSVVGSNKLITLDVPDQDFGVPSRMMLTQKLTTFLNDFERDSLIIQTINLGEAHVISNQYLDQHIQKLNRSINGYLEQGVLKRLSDTQVERDQLVKMYNIKAMENTFLHKKIRFYETHIGHIVESLVAQRTNDLIFQNDSLKLELDNTHKKQEIEQHHIRDDIKREFLDSLQNHATQYQVLQNRFHDYRKGINMDLGNFIDEYRSKGLRKIQDSTVQALREGVTLTSVRQEAPVDLAEEHFSKESEKLIKLFKAIRKLRLFYQLREGTIKEKFDAQITRLQQASSSNEDLQKKIGDLTDKIEQLKDELTSNKRVMTVMDNQNQILRRDLQKLKIDRIKAMKEKGIMGAAHYQQRFGSEQERPESPIKQINIEEHHPTTISYSEQSRPITAISNKRSLITIDRTVKPKNETTQQKISGSKSAVLSIKYRIQKK